MKVLLVGSEGSIGQRYQVILNAMNIRFYRCDPVLGKDYRDFKFRFDKVLICCPTDSHFQVIDWCCKEKLPFLCEKPLSRSVEQCQQAIDDSADIKGYVVNNWKWALSPTNNSYYKPTYFNFYNTGKDGLLWDCCQLIYLNPDIELHNDSPVWTCKAEWHGKEYRIDYRDIELSYIQMIDHWLTGDGSGLWTLEDGLKMTKAVIERSKRGHK